VHYHFQLPSTTYSYELWCYTLVTSWILSAWENSKLGVYVQDSKQSRRFQSDTQFLSTLKHCLYPSTHRWFSSETSTKKTHQMIKAMVAHEGKCNICSRSAAMSRKPAAPRRHNRLFRRREANKWLGGKKTRQQAAFCVRCSGVASPKIWVGQNVWL